MASAKKISGRVFAAVGALLFIAASIGSSAYVLWQQHQSDQSASSSTNSTGSNSVDNQNKLQGTKLANFTPITAPVTQLQAIDTKVGTGATVKAGDTVTVDYTGAVASTGVIFQSSLDSGQTATFGLNQVIKGWTDGMPGMKVGGERRLIIPAAEAYGANPPAGSGIPANADLVFDITLHSIGQ